MLRSKSGRVSFTVVNNETQKREFVKTSDYLSRKQLRSVASKPDCMWQFAQRLKKEYAQRGEDISVYVNAKISVNRRPYETYIDPNIDLANTTWNYFWHNDWILPSKLDVEPKSKLLKR